MNETPVVETVSVFEPVRTHYTPAGKRWTEREVADWALHFRPDIRLYQLRGMKGYRVIDEKSELFGHFVQCGTKWDDVASKLEIP